MSVRTAFGYRASAIFLCLLLTYSTSPAGVEVVATTLTTAVRQWSRTNPPQFTDSPIPVLTSPNDKRDPVKRGGVWNDLTLGDLRRALLEWSAPTSINAYASLEPALPDPGDPAGESASGTNWPWEGKYYFPWGRLNTNTGNVVTPMPITSWPSRRGMGVGLTLFHNSQSTYNANMGVGWSHSYDARLSGTWGQTIVCRWGDGTNVPFTFDLINEVYVPPTGIFDKLTQQGFNWKITTPDGTVYTFTEAGKRLMSIADRAGNVVSISRTGADERVNTVTCPTGRTLTFSYVGSNLSSITDYSGRVWELNYTDGKISSIRWPQLATNYYSRHFTYTSINTQTGIAYPIDLLTDRRGKVWDYGYSQGKLVSCSTPLGHTTTVQWLPSQCRIFLPLGQVSSDQYTEGKLTSRTDEASFTEAFTYGANNLISTYTDKRGKQWAFTYDGNGNVLTERNPLFHTWIYTYNPSNDLLTARDPLNNLTQFTDDGVGNLITVTDPLNRVVATNTYTAYGQLWTTKNAMNETTTLGYNAQGDVVSVTDPTNKTVEMAYDTRGLPLWVEDPLDNRTSMVYDSWGRPTRVTHPDTNYAIIDYDPEDNVVSETNERGKLTTYLYDNAGRLTSTTNALNHTESYGYNNNSWLTSVTNARNYVRTYEHTARGEVFRLTMPDANVESWSFNANGDVTQYTNGANNGVIYVYDDAGRNTNVDYFTNTDTAFTYDNAGRVTQMVDGSGTTSWTYNVASELTQLTTPQGTLQYTYQPSGRRLTMTQTGIGTFTYGYDLAGRITSLSNPWSENYSFLYDGAGRLQRKTHHNGNYELFGYDSRSRVSSIELKKADNSVLRTKSYTYGPTSNVDTAVSQGVTTTYGYDDLDQLISEAKTGYSASYTYDPNGNRATRTLNGLLETYTNDSGDKLTSVTWAGGSKTFTYDLAGNMKTQVDASGTRTYTWDQEGRLTSILYPNASTNTHTYNGLRARVRKVDVASGTRNYLRDGVSVTDPLVHDGNISYTPGLAERFPGSNAKRYLHQDLVGSMAEITKEDANVEFVRQYDAFGNITQNPNSFPRPHGFAFSWAYQEDRDSKLNLVGHRYYDPSLGRFITRDPIGSGRNWYTYCENNPLAYVDPSGLKPRTELREGAGTSVAPEEETWELVYDLVMDVGGTLDPFGPIDAAHASSYLYRGDYGNAATTSLGFVPGLGDLAKVSRFGKNLGKLLRRLFKTGNKPANGAIDTAGTVSRGGQCFVAGTLIVMADGTTKPIEEIEAGDAVLTRSQDGDEASELQAGTVIRAFARQAPGTILLELEDGQTIETTDEHPFYVEGKGFVHAAKLAVDDRIAEDVSESTRILAIVRLGETRKVYNFEVDVTHTYFVRAGDDSVWVHNAPGCITGYTEHGLHSAISHDGYGVHPSAMLDAVNNPRQVIPGNTPGSTKYVGENAVVVLNDKGKVITTYPLSSRGRRNPVRFK